MNHLDLLEDVILGMVVALTTVAALYAGWRAGIARRRPPIARDDGIQRDGLRAGREAAAHSPMGSDDWSQRLAAEQARCARHGSTATVVAIRVDEPRGADGRDGGAGVEAATGTVAAMTRRARASDSICVASDGTIRVLLVETSEVDARRFVDRISAELSIEPNARGNIVAAWAAIAPGRNLRAAERLAVARLRGAASGWLRSLAVHRVGEPAPDVADLDGGSADARRTVR